MKREEREGYTALQLGAGAKRPKQLPGTLRGHFKAAGVPLKRKLAEFRVSPDAMLPVGQELRASHFVAGQYVDVSGTSIGKGFQGVMKRWNFAGQPASHGNSLAHRAAGSTGACQVCGEALLRGSGAVAGCRMDADPTLPAALAPVEHGTALPNPLPLQDPGKVFKGKKMPGRLGGERTTVQNCQVFRVDPVRNLLYVRGQVPGHKGNWVLVRDAVKKSLAQQPPLPVPTLLEAVHEVTVAPKSPVDPYDFKE